MLSADNSWRWKFLSLTPSTSQAASDSSTQQVSSSQQGWGQEGQFHNWAAAHSLLLPTSGSFHAGRLFIYSREQHVSLWACRMSRGCRISTQCPPKPPLCRRCHTRPKSSDGAQLSMRRGQPAHFTALPPHPGPREPRCESAHALSSAPSRPWEPSEASIGARAWWRTYARGDVRTQAGRREREFPRLCGSARVVGSARHLLPFATAVAPATRRGLRGGCRRLPRDRVGVRAGTGLGLEAAASAS